MLTSIKKKKLDFKQMLLETEQQVSDERDSALQSYGDTARRDSGLRLKLKQLATSKSNSMTIDVGAVYPETKK